MPASATQTGIDHARTFIKSVTEFITVKPSSNRSIIASIRFRCVCPTTIKIRLIKSLTLCLLEKEIRRTRLNTKMKGSSAADTITNVPPGTFEAISPNARSTPEAPKSPAAPRKSSRASTSVARSTATVPKAAEVEHPSRKLK